MRNSVNNNRRSFLKYGAILATTPVIYKFSSVGNLVGAESSVIGSGLVKNGTVNTATHWGVLKVTIKDGKVIKSEPFKKDNNLYNSLHNL